MSYDKPTREEIIIRRAQLAAFDTWNEKTYLALFSLVCAHNGIPQRYLDLGSGTGAMVNMARRIGVEAYGVDLIAESPGREHWLLTADLSKPVGLVRTALNKDRVFNMFDMTEKERSYITGGLEGYFDLVTCVEVAEHMPPESADTLGNTIASHMSTGSYLVFSAAPPGQGGEHHQNLRPAEYWRSLLYDKGLSYRQDLTMELSHLWSWVSGPMQWLGANVQVFDK